MNSNADSQLSIRQSIKYYSKPLNQNISPIAMCEDEDKRMSGITNSADIVKVKDSNYVVTDVADYTQFAQVSNKIDQSPSALQIAQSSAGIGHQSNQSSILNLNYRASHIPLKQSLLQQQQLLQYQQQERQYQNPSVYGHSAQGRSQLQISEQNPIKTSMNDNDEKSEFHVSNSKFNPITGMTGGTLNYGTQGSSSASCLLEQRQKSQSQMNNSSQNNGVNLMQPHNNVAGPQPKMMTAVPSTSVFNYSLKSFNDGLKQQQEPDMDSQDISQIQTNGGLVLYNQQPENHLLQDYEEFKQQNHFSFNFQQQDLQFIKQQQLQQQLLFDQPLEADHLQSETKQKQIFQGNFEPLVNGSTPFLIIAHSRMAPQTQNQMLSSHLREQNNQSTYSDDNKKSVFLYSSSNDEINFHQLNPQGQLQLSQKFYQNAPVQQNQRPSQIQTMVPIGLEGGNQYLVNNGQVLSGIMSGHGSGPGTGNNSSKASHKNSIQFFSKINSNSSVGMGQTIYPMSQADLQNNVSSPQNHMFKTTSSNFQISEITSSLIKDGTQTSLINFNPPQNYTNFLAQQTLPLNGTKSIEEDNYDYEHQDYQREQDQYSQQHHFKDPQQKQSDANSRYPSDFNSISQNQDEPRQEQDSSNMYVRVSYVEDSFQYCDYDEYLEEKCSLSDNAVTVNENGSQQQPSQMGSQLHSLQNSQSKQSQQMQPKSAHQQSRSHSLNSNFHKISADLNSNSEATSHINDKRNQHQYAPSISQSSQGLPPKNPIGKDHSLTNSEYKYGSIALSEHQSNLTKDKSNNNKDSITNYQSTQQEPISKRNDGSLFQSNVIGGSSIIPNSSAARNNRSLHKNQINYSKRSKSLSSERKSIEDSNQNDYIDIKQYNDSKISQEVQNDDQIIQERHYQQNVLNLTASTPTDGINSASMTTLSNQLHQNPSDYRTSLHPGEAHLVFKQDRQVVNAYLENGYLEQDIDTVEDENGGFVETFGGNDFPYNPSEHLQHHINYPNSQKKPYLQQSQSNQNFILNNKPKQLQGQAQSKMLNGSSAFNNSGMNVSSSENFTYTHSNTNTHTKIGQGLSTTQQLQKSTQLYGDEEQYPPNISTSQDQHQQNLDRDLDDPYQNEDEDYQNEQEQDYDQNYNQVHQADEEDQLNYEDYENEDQQDTQNQQMYGLQSQKQGFAKKASVADRLLYQDKLKQQKIELKRMQKQNEEMMQCTGVPQISRNSVEILRSKDMTVPAYLDFENHFEAQRRKEDLKRAYDNQKLKEVTGKPRISEKAQSLTRDVSDLYSWQKDLQRKKEDLQRIKEEKERKELEKHQQEAQKYVNKESQKILQNKENLYSNQRIEERLISIGVMNKVKKEQAAHRKVLENIQVANSHHQKRDKKSKNSIILENRRKLNDTQSEKVLSAEELKHISANKERKDLYQKYYKEKKREAEVKLLSTEKLQEAFNMSPRGKAYDPHGISRNNLYQTQQFNSVGNLQNMLPLEQQMRQSQQFSNNQIQFPLTPTHHQTIQGVSQSIFDVQRPINYCSFGNVQQSLQNSLSFPGSNLETGVMNPYSTLQQNTMSPFSNASQTCNDIYAQLIMQAQSQNNSTFVSTNIDQPQCLSNMFGSGLNSQAYQTQGSACFNLKANSVCDGGSNASTTCFDKFPDLHFQSAKTLDQNGFKNEIMVESRLSSQNPYRINIPGVVTESRSRSKSKGKQGNSKQSQSRGRQLHQQNDKINQLQYSLSPHSKQKVVGDGKLQSAKDNTRFYERSRKWSKERENKILHEQEKTNIIETLKCTFRPKISENSNRLMSPDYLEQKSRSIIDPHAYPKTSAPSNPATFKQQSSQQQPNYLSYRNNQKIMKPVTLTKEIMIEQFINSSISPLKDNERLRAEEDGDNMSNDNSFSQDSQQQDAFLVQVMNSNPYDSNHQSDKENYGNLNNGASLSNQMNGLASMQSYGLQVQSNADISSKNFNLMRSSQGSANNSIYSQSNQSLTQKNDYQGFTNQVLGHSKGHQNSQIQSRNSQVMNSARHTSNNSEQYQQSVTQGNNQSMNLLSYSQSSSILMSQHQPQPSQQEYQSRYGLQSTRN